jgi:non-specific serine/threonine protein kinase
MAEVEKLLKKHRLLTLTGPGGSGKTRLALAVAREVLDGYEDGAWLVELAPLSDPELVPQAVASVLMVREAPGRSLLETLAEHLRSKTALLVLDNCEHLVGASASLAEALLRRCPDLSILATSREALGVEGETLFVVPPLSLPDPRHLPALDGLSDYEAVYLFAERARAVRPGFEITEENAVSVAKVCHRLDGMPLAIELAAARARALSVEQISSRLDDAFRLLTGGSRTASAHHATLRATMDWSYDLLSTDEKVIFGRLSVFAGGFSLEAAEAVCAGGSIGEGEVLDLLSSLVSKSLVLVEEQDGETCYGLLETVRQYASERLEESGEAEEVGGRHARHYLALAEEAEPELVGTRQEAWMGRLEAQHDNLRAALSWALAHEDAELGLRLGGALGEFWHMRGHLGEGRGWLEAVLAKGGGPEAARAKALGKAGWISWEQGDYERSIATNEEGLALARQGGDRAAIALALSTLGVGELELGKAGRAAALFEEAMALQRASGDTAGLVRTISFLGFAAVIGHDYERAAALHEEGLGLAREAADASTINVSLLTLGAQAHLGLGDHRRARALYEEGLALARRLRLKHYIATLLHAPAMSAVAEGRPERAARLWGAAEALREAIGAILTPTERSYYGPHIGAARSRLGDELSWEAAWAEGRAMTQEEAIEYALATEGSATSRSGDAPSSLSERETEVLSLVAEGLTNAGVARRLYLSPHTVNRHLRSVYRKLGVSSRAAASREASKRGLI